MAKLSAHGYVLAEFERLTQDDDDCTRRRCVAVMSDGHLLRKTGYRYNNPVRWHPKGWQMTSWKLWKSVCQQLRQHPDIEACYAGLTKLGYVRKK